MAFLAEGHASIRNGETYVHPVTFHRLIELAEEHVRCLHTFLW